MIQRARDAGARALREHLVFLNDATIKIGASLDLEEIVRGLGHAVVPFLADFVAIHLLDRLLSEDLPGVGVRDGQEAAIAALRRVVVVHDDEPARWRDIVPEGEVQVMRPASPGRRAMTSLQPLVLPTIGPDMARALASTHRTGDLEPLIRGRSMLAIPLSAGGRVLGCAILLRKPGRSPFDDIDVLTASQLAAQASQGDSSR